MEEKFLAWYDGNIHLTNHLVRVDIAGAWK
ncbi:hypothetical protein FHS45_001429 [Thalassobacillus devorans]|nr:hypothetical protein [Thalassobacillus devorans]